MSNVKLKDYLKDVIILTTNLPRVIFSIIKEYCQPFFEFYSWTSDNPRRFGKYSYSTGDLLYQPLEGFGYKFINPSRSQDYIYSPIGQKKGITLYLQHFVIYHIPTKRFVERRAKNPPDGNFYVVTKKTRSKSRKKVNDNAKPTDLNKRVKMFVHSNPNLKQFFTSMYDSRGHCKINQMTDIYNNVMYSAATSEGIYTFGRYPYRSSTSEDQSGIYDAWFYNFAKRAFTMLKPSPRPNAIPIVISDDAILVISQDKADAKDGNVFLYTPSKNDYARQKWHFPYQCMDCKTLKYQNDVLFCVGYEELYYLCQPFEENEWVYKELDNVCLSC